MESGEVPGSGQEGRCQVGREGEDARQGKWEKAARRSRWGKW